MFDYALYGNRLNFYSHLILDCDTVLGGMLEADISIREENDENLENFRQFSPY